jgi:hypothetical protein
VGKPSRIKRPCASDSATNLHFYNGILRVLRQKPRESAESSVGAFGRTVGGRLRGVSGCMISFAAGCGAGCETGRSFTSSLSPGSA